MIKLKDYQHKAVAAIKTEFTKNRRQYVEMPTGSGKTITYLYYAKNNHNNVLIVVPSVQLMNQVYESALNFYNREDISRKGGDYFENIRKIHICIIHSIRGEYLQVMSSLFFDLVIIDEAHHSQAPTYRRLIEGRERILKDEWDGFRQVLGVTATPDRTDGKFISEILFGCSFKLEITDLIHKGHLCDIEGFSIKTNIDLGDIHTHNGDFPIKELYNKLCVDNRNKMIFKVYKENLSCRKSLIFCINIEHSKQVNQLLNDQGISSAHIDGTMNLVERQSILNSFRDGSISCLCNCQLLTEGFDEPSIDGIILARPTVSRSLFLQMVGRGLRTSPGKSNCKIIDIVDNHKLIRGFNSVVTDERFQELSSFKSIIDIEIHVEKTFIEISDFFVQKANILSFQPLDDMEATGSMIEYLRLNKVYHPYPISLDDASFLIWFNELKKEYICQ